MNRTAMGTFETLIIPLLILVLWTLASSFQWVNPYLLPSPGRVFLAACHLAETGELAKHLIVSFKRVLAGFSVTLVIAVPLSFLIYILPVFKRLLRVPLEFLRSVPPISTIPLLILWFGIGEASKMAVIVMASFFPVFLNLMGGLNTIEKEWQELSETLKFNHAEYIRYVLFPGAFPSFLTGIQLGLSYCWRALMGAEMIAAASGLGYLILDSQEMGRIDKVFVGIITLGICGIVLDRVLIKLFNRLIPWKDLEVEHKW
ncbi:ABC-type transporter, permease protein (membrane spanning protein) [Desulforapulum autotrophicum HRM2]|uniref:ABC-type transporter, permease protein (Membrane spanning protein) n=1 Tax=Desulforapulum autotrophicum (strain ATCC 43914 / DSM 3382 / VKM B-1955 / HRM2) TaxID=177437 RepID=C0QEG0_DESAH|nr:ABC transporter permease [Desulforapulum autotrophicum]ACN13277.1 ABC-type transporter, permease protein (membrane spanning protein) [Desulforapulum autotrophicum HRM2]